MREPRARPAQRINRSSAVLIAELFFRGDRPHNEVDILPLLLDKQAPSVDCQVVTYVPLWRTFTVTTSGPGGGLWCDDLN
jgi:hypothetical protein